MTARTRKAAPTPAGPELGPDGKPRLVSEYFRVADLRNYHQNAHKGNLTRIRASLRDHAQYKPVVVNRGTLTGRPNEVLCGNHTLLAADMERWEWIQGVTVDVDDVQAAKINLIDNPRAGHEEDLGYDERLLLEQLSALPTLDGTGYDPGDLVALEKALAEQDRESAQGGVTDDDAVPDLPAVVRCQVGDIWQLGQHRLMCADARHQAQVTLALDGQSPAVIYSDPPYGIRAVPKDGGVSRGGPFGGIKNRGISKEIPANRYEQVAGDADPTTARDVFALLYGLYPEARHVWWGANHYAATAQLPDASCWLVWDKDNGASDFADAELAWTNHPGAVRQLRHMWNGMLRASEHSKRIHPTQKPVALAAWAFDEVKAPEEGLVLDVFAGSGSTLIAAHQTGRLAVLMEMVPAYCDVICRRWQEYTTQLPTLDGVAQDFTVPPAV